MQYLINIAISNNRKEPKTSNKYGSLTIAFDNFLLKSALEALHTVHVGS